MEKIYQHCHPLRLTALKLNLGVPVWCPVFSTCRISLLDVSSSSSETIRPPDKPEIKNESRCPLEAKTSTLQEVQLYLCLPIVCFTWNRQFNNIQPICTVHTNIHTWNMCETKLYTSNVYKKEEKLCVVQQDTVLFSIMCRIWMDVNNLFGFILVTTNTVLEIDLCSHLGP